MDYSTDKIYIYTCREGGEIPGQQRVYTFHGDGGVAWSALEKGHIHTGWGANIRLRDDGGADKIVMAMREHFVPDDTGFNHEVDGVFYFDAFTGREINFIPEVRGDKIYPIDLDGDGLHEFFVGEGPRRGELLDTDGKSIDRIPVGCFRIGKMLGYPGEQIMGVGQTVTLWKSGETLMLRMER